MLGLDGTPYESGIFKLEIKIPDKWEFHLYTWKILFPFKCRKVIASFVVFNSYPQSPPCLRFKTPVYHPNIDDNGRICLDLLKMPPEGSWRPVITLESVLLSIQQLLGSPNPDDPLMADIVSCFFFANSCFFLIFVLITFSFSGGGVPLQQDRIWKEGKKLDQKTCKLIFHENTERILFMSIFS